MFTREPHHPKGLRQTIKKLGNEISTESCYFITVRFILFLLLFIFGSAYAGSQPKVYHDVLIWQHGAKPPYTVYIYRNLTSWIDNPNGTDITVLESFMWNETYYPGYQPYNCNDTRFIGRIDCDEGWLQSNRIGFEDSLGFKGDDEEIGVFYIDRYVFWMVLVFSGVSVGHCLVCLCHSLQPDGIGFYLYEAVMDFTLALAFLSLGIFPLAWLPNGMVGGRTGFPERWNYTVSDQLFKNRYDLRTSTAMGWICFILFAGLVTLNISMVTRLNMFKRTAPGAAVRDPIAMVESTCIPELRPINTTGSYRRDHAVLRGRSQEANDV